jgi:2',3'-cyclic-nucleotide 2'-phosphodiesterase/3'-nucleotidase/5'-nucleotidase
MPSRAYALTRLAACAACALISFNSRPQAAADKDITLQPLGTYASGTFNGSASEIVAHDPGTQRLFVVNFQAASIDVLDVSDPTAPSLDFAIDLHPYGGHPNSVAVDQGMVAVAVEAVVKTDPGKTVFFDTDGVFLASVTVGALPDMLTFSPDHRYVLVANEAEPDPSYTPDPEGSVSIIDLEGGVAALTQAAVTTVGLEAFNHATLDSSIRIFGPGASVAQDLEPEYITISHDSRTAWVTLQENNAIAELDIRSATFTKLSGLGFKNHALPSNAFDPSDRDGGVHIGTWPVWGMYQPDGIASFRSQGQTYLVLANEGDSREYSAFDETARVSSLTLDPVAFPNAAALKAPGALGRLTVTKATGDTDHDGDMDALYVFGGRSFSIRSTDGALVFDSGSDLETRAAAALPADFNSSNDSNGSFDTRSDNKGPEPEGVTVAKIFGREYVFVALERIGGILVYDVTSPASVRFVQYLNTRNFAGSAKDGTAGDLGPEQVIVIAEEDSPIGAPLLVSANEVSGTTSVFKIVKAK